MSMKKMDRVENLIWIIFSILGSVFLVIGLGVCSNIFNKDNKVETIGTISNMYSYRNSDGDTNYNVFVTYIVDGVEYESRLNGYSSNFYEGKRIKIYYDKNNPNKIGSESLDLLFLLFPGIGFIFAMIGIIRNIYKTK